MRLLILLFTITTFTSCVSSKKYKKLQADQSALQNEYNKLQEKYRQLTGTYQDLEKSSKTMAEMNETELRSLNAELQAKIKNIQEANARLEESNKKINELQAAIQKQKEAGSQLLSKIKDALVGFSSEELQVTMRDGKVYVSMSEQLLFKSGSANVDPKGKQALSKVAEVLIKQNDVDIVVEGHTDNVPLKGSVIKDNWDLSVMRATNVVKILTADYKLNPKQVVASGRGEFFPIADNSTTEGKAQNRRTEIILSPKLSELLKILENP
jgi:chemotaxis protein MotB